MWEMKAKKRYWHDIVQHSGQTQTDNLFLNRIYDDSINNKHYNKNIQTIINNYNNNNNNEAPLFKEEKKKESTYLHPNMH